MLILREDALIRCGVRRCDRVLVALSGGADSVALLLAFRSALERGRIASLGAAHLNHGIRGEEADRDESFCRDLCASIGVPFYARRVDVPALAKQSGQSLEAAARIARYAFLNEVLKTGGYTLLATAHHRDDQAETLLLHLLRGCGTDGLAGMRERTGALIRPLLTVSRNEILAYLDERGQPYCTDSTNNDDDALRNRIRHAVLPLLDTLRPDASKAIAETAALVGTDADYLNAEADRLFESVGDRASLAALPDALRLRVLKRYLPYDSYDRLDLKKLDALLTAKNGAQRDLKQGYVAWAFGDRLTVKKRGDSPFDREPYCVSLAIGETVSIPHGTVTAAAVKNASFPCDARTAYLNRDAIQGNLTVRSLRAGDRFTPLGMKGHKLVSDCFIDRKVQREDRAVPVVEDETGILWVAGLTVDERARVSDGDKVVQLRWESETID